MCEGAAMMHIMMMTPCGKKFNLWQDDFGEEVRAKCFSAFVMTNGPPLQSVLEGVWLVLL